MLTDQIEQDIISAMKEKQEMQISTLRMLKSALKNKEIQNKKELADEDIVQVIQSQIKSRQDSIKMYEQGGRKELAQKEKDEIEILKKYLPEQHSEDEIKTKVAQIIQETQAQSIQDMGKVMGKASQEFRGKADMALVSQIVKDCLTK